MRASEGTPRWYWIYVYLINSMKNQRNGNDEGDLIKKMFDGARGGDGRRGDGEERRERGKEGNTKGERRSRKKLRGKREVSI